MMQTNISQLFDSIANSYDKLNHLFSLNIDKYWRKKTLKNHISSQHQIVLDVACGTADMSLALANAGVNYVEGIDISQKMIEKGIEKIKKNNNKSQIHLQVCDCEKLPFPSNYFDAVVIAFGIRNFEHRELSLLEIYRVLKPNADLIILEFSHPQNFLIKPIYKVYLSKIIPKVGGWISKNRKAYQYLQSSIYEFPQGKKLLQELQQINFCQLSQKRMTFGIVSAYYGKKKK